MRNSSEPKSQRISREKENFITVFCGIEATCLWKSFDRLVNLYSFKATSITSVVLRKFTACSYKVLLDNSLKMSFNVRSVSSYHFGIV